MLDMLALHVTSDFQKKIKKGKISVDAYDPNDLRVKLKGQYEVAQDTYLIGQIKDINDSDERARLCRL